MTIAQDRLNLEGNNFPSKTAKTVSRAWSMMSGHKWRLYQRSFPAIGFPLPLVSGRNKPDATMMVSFEDGSALIIITDGMVMFVDSVCRAMASGANWHGRNGAILDAAAFSPGAVDGALLSTYQQWRKLLADDNLAPPSIALSDQGEELAWGYFAPAIMYILMHEFGHAALHRDLPFAKTQEIEADLWAIDALLTVFGEQTNQVNISLAGALVAIRSFAAVDAVVPNAFPEGYPAPAERFEAILARFRQRCPDDISYFIDSTIAFAMDMRMLSTELAFKGEVSRGPLRPEQLVSMIVSLLVEVFWKRLSLDEVARTVDAIFKSASSNLVAGSARLARSAFSPLQQTCPLEGQVGSRAREIIKNFGNLLPHLDGPGKLFAVEVQK